MIKKSFFLFAFLLLLFYVNLMDLDHCLLVLLVVVRPDGPRRTDHLYDFGKLVHFGPVSSIKAVDIPEVDVGPVSHK